MERKDVITIGISVVALLGSAFTFWWGERETHRNREREYLEDFLRPLKWILDSNRATHRSLTADTKLEHLEFAPDYVWQALHRDLRPDDPRRLIWRAEISRLMSENDKAVTLLDRHIGRVESERLRRHLEAFKEHTLKWQAMWRAVLNPDPQVVEGYIGVGLLKTEPFPKGLDELLAGEIARIERLVGVNTR
jgi:hypothetical protein